MPSGPQTAFGDGASGRWGDGATFPRPVASAAVLLLLLALSIGPARGQERGDALARMRAAYEQFDYAAVERLAQEALDNYRAYAPGELAAIHVLLGRVRFAQGRPEAARAQFRAALSLQPALELDPLLVSPKVLELFRTVRQEISAARERASETAAAGAPRYVVLRDPRPAATLRSIVLPGWGQLYKGQEIKGWTLIGLWGGTLVGSGIAHLIRAEYRDAYLSATDPAVAKANYPRYSTWHKVRNSLLLGAALVWGYGVIDALLTRTLPAPVRRAVNVTPRLSPRSQGVQMTVRF